MIGSPGLAPLPLAEPAPPPDGRRLLESSISRWPTYWSTNRSASLTTLRLYRKWSMTSHIHDTIPLCHGPTFVLLPFPWLPSPSPAGRGSTAHAAARSSRSTTSGGGPGGFWRCQTATPTSRRWQRWQRRSPRGGSRHRHRDGGTASTARRPCPHTPGPPTGISSCLPPPPS